MENKVTLTMKEQHKLKMVIDYEAGKVGAQRAAELLGISKRQFRRLVAAYRQRGIAALAHGNRGRSPAAPPLRGGAAGDPPVGEGDLPGLQ